MRKIGGILLATVFLLIAIFASTTYGVRGIENVIGIYFLFIASEIIGFHRLTAPFRPFLVVPSVYLLLKVITINLPILAIYIKPIETELLLLLFALALTKLELPTKFQPAITSVGLILTGYFGYTLISKLPFKEAEDLAIIFAILLVILAITTLLPAISKKLSPLRQIRAFILSVTIIVSIYVTFIRPLLADRPGLVNLIDWLIVAGVFFKASSALRSAMEVEETEIVRIHEQKVGVKRDEIIDSVEKAKSDFIERGLKSPLIVVLTQILLDAGWSRDRIVEAVAYIVSHEDKKVPALAFGWERRWIESRNRKRREEVLKKLEEYLSEEGVKFGS